MDSGPFINIARQGTQGSNFGTYLTVSLINLLIKIYYDLLLNIVND